jgi:hypothetical protein
MTEHMFAVAAHIDLLGFADHQAVGAADIRTQIGQAAVERLHAMENALRLLDKERRASPTRRNSLAKRCRQAIRFKPRTAQSRR